MFSADLGGAPPAATPAATDPPFQKVALLLHGDGTNGAQNNTFVDYSYPGGYAVSFDGAGDYLSVPYGSGFNLSTNNFTIEGWFYFTSVASGQQILTGYSNVSTNRNFAFYIQSSGTLSYYLSSNGTSWNIASGVALGSIQVNTWYHIAIVRNGNTFTPFINGVSGTTSTSSSAIYNSNSPIIIGADPTGSSNFNGFVSNLRIVNGTALYTSNFTPSNQPLTAVSGTQLLTCQSATIVDNSPNAFTITANGNAAAVSSKTITRTGNVAQGTFSPFSLSEGQWSNYFDGSGDYLTTQSSSVVDFGTGDFTIEMFVWFGRMIDYQILFDGRLASAAVQIFSSGNGTLYYDVKASDGVTTILRLSSLGLSSNTWLHIAISRSSNTTKLFINGVQKASGSDTQIYASGTNRPTIGAGYDTTTAFLGYISNVRVVKGTAVYTSNFTPPTSPLTAISGTSLLTCQSNRFKDNSSNNFTITPAGDTKVTAFSPFAPSAAYSASTNGGSAYFDGSGDYLQYDNTAWGTGDYNVEMWVYLTVAGGTRVLLDCRNYGGTPTGDALVIYLSGSGTLYTNYVTASTTTVPVGQWNHIAVSRASGTMRIYMNGVLLNSGANSTNFGAFKATIGNQPAGAFYQGYITDLRIITGSALYTGSTYTVPTAPLSVVTNTLFLLNCTNAGIIDNAGKNDIETVGNAQISTSVKKYGTGSMAFDAVTTTGLYSPSKDIFTYGTGDFTIEFWMYANAAAAAIVFDQRASGSSVTPTIYLSSGNVIYHVNGTDRITSSSAISTGVWYHIAVCRSGTSTKLFVNGTQSGSTYTDSNNYILSPVYIGKRWDATSPFNGYIDDLRITKGQALYTSNFTPPTQAFPNV